MNIIDKKTCYIVVEYDYNRQISEYKKDNLQDMNQLCEYLIDQYRQAEDKQKQWFNKYWDEKKKVNSIKDIME